MGLNFGKFKRWVERTARAIFTPENIITATIMAFTMGGASFANPMHLFRKVATYAVTNAAIQTLSTPNTPNLSLRR